MQRARLALVVLLAAVGLAGAGQPRAATKKILVPAYFYPAGAGLTQWDHLAAATREIGKSGVEVVAIVNPSSGPGDRADPHYRAIVRKMNKAGVKTIGYVSTKFGKAPPADVAKVFSRWKQFYPEIQGFFLDEQASDARFASQYLVWCKTIRTRMPHALIVSNPGTICDRAYFAKEGPDIVCVHETSRSLQTYTPPDWLKKQPASRLAALIYSIADAKGMAEQAALANKSGVGCLFVNSETLPNPWGKLPAYWMQLVRQWK